MTVNIKHLIEKNKEEFYKDLDKVMQIESVKGAPLGNAPFGIGPKQALEQVMKIASDYGFKTNIVNDAVGYAQFGEGDDYIGIVGHLDVVPAGDGWSFPPFKLSKKDEKFYGRGVLDNKGPIMSCLFGLKLLKDMGIKPIKPIRIIFGTDEESGSSDLPLYLAEEIAPIFAFTPDCKYPVVYGERGIVNYTISTHFDASELQNLTIQGDQSSAHVPDELTAIFQEELYHVLGKRSPSNAPELGENAITILATKLSSNKEMSDQLRRYFLWVEESFSKKHYGEGIGLDFEDEDSGKLILTPYELKVEQNTIQLSIAIRYPVSTKEEEVTEQLHKVVPKESEIKIIRQLKSTSFPKDDTNVKKLSAVYEKITGLDGTPVTTTGATYARFFPNTVAFGPSFPGQKGIAHNSNEYMDEKDLLLNMEIYMEAILALACD